MSGANNKVEVESIETSSPVEQSRKAAVPVLNIIPCTPERICDNTELLFEAKKKVDVTALLGTPQRPELIEETIKDYEDQMELSECHYTTPERPKCLESDDE